MTTETEAAGAVVAGEADVVDAAVVVAVEDAEWGLTD